MDVVIPNNNEEEFIEIAKKLGLKELIFLYELKDYKSKKLDFKTDVKLGKGLLVKSVKDVLRVQNNEKLVFAQNPDRGLLESKKVTHVFEIENQQKKDFLHHRNSGLNQVYAKIMRDSNKKLCFSYSFLLNHKNKSVIIGRFSQNKKIIKKYKVKTLIFSFARKPYDLRAKIEKDALFNIL